MSPRKPKRKAKPKAAVTATAPVVVQTLAKPRGNPRTLAIAHLALVLEDPKASPARKDKAARLLLSHAAAPPTRAELGRKAAEAPKGKKELQADEASTAGASTKWAGLLQ